MPRTELQHFLKAEEARFHVQFYDRSGGRGRQRVKRFMEKYGSHDAPVVPAEAPPSSQERVHMVGSKRPGPKPKDTMTQVLFFFCEKGPFAYFFLIYRSTHATEQAIPRKASV
jgi:hypothetical protein